MTLAELKFGPTSVSELRVSQNLVIESQNLVIGFPALQSWHSATG
jgi:hypothetical protein